VKISTVFSMQFKKMVSDRWSSEFILSAKSNGFRFIIQIYSVTHVSIDHET